MLRFRDVRPDDVDLYVRMRCDPVMMAELGGPQLPDDMPRKVARDAEQAATGTEWILLILPDEDDETVAGSVVIWRHDDDGEPMAEIGWMVLPEFQGRGLAKAAVRAVLDRAAAESRWGLIHAFPGATNGPSNGLCRSLGFTLVGPTLTDFAGRILSTNHWRIDPATRV